ncbi:Glycine-rich RNA-binding protein RZ1C [Zea mays]|uniref:Glycine-rich RNA-binding protein RZ1C n=1 Tax=Zea mays TaxID=4577 RepID=A0A1D6GKG9_MAIZE|nr:Glycine-rich RNA-binding protein RZ1C [Zea mays]
MMVGVRWVRWKDGSVDSLCLQSKGDVCFAYEEDCDFCSPLFLPLFRKRRNLVSEKYFSSLGSVWLQSLYLSLDCRGISRGTEGRTKLLHSKPY